MKNYFTDYYKRLYEGIVLVRNHSEIFLVQTIIIFVSYIFAINSSQIPVYLRTSLQFILFVINLSFTLCIPRFMTSSETDIGKRLNHIVLYLQKIIPDLLIFSVIIYISNRYITKSDYVQSYNDSHTYISEMFLDGIYRLVLIATSIYFSIRTASLAQSIIDGIAFVFSNIIFSLFIIILLMPVMFIGPLYLSNFFAAIETLAEQIGIILITGIVLAYMKVHDEKLNDIVKHPLATDGAGHVYASNFRRVMGVIIDGIAYGIISIIIPLVFIGFYIFSHISLPIHAGVIAYAILFMIYVAGSWTLFEGRTLGKILTGTEIRKSDGTALGGTNILVRSLLLLFEVFGIIFLAVFNNRSHWVFDIGYLVVGTLWIGSILFLFNKTKQSLHDFAAKTVVIQTKKIHWWLSMLMLLPLILLIGLFSILIYMQANDMWSLPHFRQYKSR